LDVCYLEAGHVKLVMQGSNGRSLLTSILKPGAVFGTEPLIGGGKRHLSAISIKETTIYRVPYGEFRRLSNEFPQVWEGLTAMILERNQTLNRRMEVLFLMDIRQRLLSVLLELAEFYATGDFGELLQVPLSQEDIGAMTGSRRETASAALNALAREGLLELERGRVFIPSPERIREELYRGRSSYQERRGGFTRRPDPRVTPIRRLAAIA
jgi:CRP/FNR family transcriptional regulator, polysaccharide utilization system transcription regulator